VLRGFAIQARSSDFDDESIVRGLVSSHDWSDYVDLIEGEPDDAADALLPWGEEARPIPNDASEKSIKALCLRCYQTFPVGRYVDFNEPIQLPDGSLTDADTWRHEAGRASIGKGKRRKFFCEMCGADTQHVAVR
jgi:hypothetical protein